MILEQLLRLLLRCFLSRWGAPKSSQSRSWLSTETMLTPKGSPTTWDPTKPRHWRQWSRRLARAMFRGIQQHADIVSPKIPNVIQNMTVKCSAIFLFFSVRRYTGFTYFLSQLGHHGISGLPNGNDLCKQHKTYDANTWCKTQICTWRSRNIFSWITNTHIANIVDYMYYATVQNMNNTNRLNTQWNTTKVGRITNDHMEHFPNTSATRFLGSKTIPI